MAQFKEVGEQFAAFYYQTFDSNRALLANLYQADSMMTWEGAACQGQQAILEKLSGLGFQTVQHNITKMDCQPGPENCVLVMVIGQLKADQDQPLPFSQVFQLKSLNGNYYIYNDIFSLGLHNN
ncbi:hypothetical protein SARC_01590 [Sphaeroforma arctica JP610]|uniref:Nuclear transport factor 2 n=1 Tax=Sphaeroforma arctica JP610 TaxID=667725 RepID=A0A0L0GDE2_9EUKA|nr:hypothetical protein SARC_01590 [Sphaeroforma arctica JP610]KNC86268.1 hypothetical protein SARC_01590 [Sphaeroforma arctica JP610]|eukprot:XP_014160170.1 hypothetical protein SARC_01590 [Sphaeroforma arctica JP610]